MRGQSRAEQYCLWKGEELLSKILIVAVSLKYLLQVETRAVSVQSVLINSGQLPRWPESTSSGSLHVLSPGEHEKLRKNPTTSFRVYCQIPARSRRGSARSAAGDAAALPAGGAMLRGGCRGKPETPPPTPLPGPVPPGTRVPGAPRSGCSPQLLAQPPGLGARRWGRAELLTGRTSVSKPAA